MSLATVYFKTTAEETHRLEADSKILVSEREPDDWEVLFECHPKDTDLVKVGDGKFEITWKTVLEHPHRVSTH